METVKGYVEHIVFRNEDNGYTVFNLNNDDGDLTCVGNFNYLSEGELVEVNGEYVVHSVYGTQLRVLNYEIVLVALFLYLASSGVFRRKARLLVAAVLLITVYVIGNRGIQTGISSVTGRTVSDGAPMIA